jgi:SAM-dependent methyltransferase
MADTNRAVFRSAKVVRGFIGTEGWLDDGERAALVSVVPLVRARPILDVGVGLGRTSSLLRLMSDSYVAIDYSPEMVELCQELHPGIDVRVGDARDLSAFPDGRFHLVFFSNYGVDALDDDGRRRYLAEAHRVLDDGGILIHNTMNKNGCLYNEKPWQLHRPGLPPDLSPRNIVRWCVQNAKDPMRAPRRYRNWLANRRASADHGGWATSPMSAHDFSLLVHFVTLPQLRAELDAAGFETVSVFDCPTGEVLEASVSDSDSGGFYAVATKRAGQTPTGPAGA